MIEAISQLTQHNWRVIFYPYGMGIACQLNPYGDDTRYLWCCATSDKLPTIMEHIAKRIAANDIPSDWWYGPAPNGRELLT